MRTGLHAGKAESNTPKPACDVLGLCRYATEASPLPMLATEGLTHIVRYVNPAFCRLAGRTKKALIGRPFAEAVPEGKVNGCLSLLNRVYRTGKAENLAEQEHSHAHSSLVFWSYAVWAILDKDQRPAGVMIQVTDTTETAMFRRQVVAMNQELTLSGIRQQELTELAERVARRLQQAMLETDHRVKNNLQSIAALLDMQIMANGVTVSIEALTQLRMQIKTLASIHDMLTQDVKSDSILSRISSTAPLQKLLPMLQLIVGTERIQWSVEEVCLPLRHGISRFAKLLR